MGLSTILRDCINLILPNKSYFQHSKSDPLKLTRAIWQDDQYTKSTGIVKPGLFLPRKNEKGEWETSIANIQGMVEKKIWKYIEKKILRDRNCKGRADFVNNAVIQAKLNLRYDSKPKRHVAIVGWPAEKHEQKSKAIDLIADTKLVLKPG